MHPGLAGGKSLHELVGAVGRSVGRHHHLEPVGGIVELEQVREPLLDYLLFVVGSHDDAHAGLELALPHPARAKTRHDCREQRIAEMRP